MTEQSPSAIGTVAQEAARLIEDMATMARSSYSQGRDAGAYAGESAERPVSPDGSPVTDRAEDGEARGSDARGSETGPFEAGGSEAGGAGAADGHSEDACSMCGSERQSAPRDSTPSTCRICPLCRGVALLGSVRPETVDMLADLAMSVASTLRDVAKRSRASDPASTARSGSGGSPDPDRSPVQDIPVDDESEG